MKTLCLKWLAIFIDAFAAACHRSNLAESPRATHARHPIQLFVRASSEEEAQMNVRYRVELSQTERAELTTLLSGGKHAARKLKRAQILLAADAGASDDDITTSVGVGGSTVYRTKQRFVLGNLKAALNER